MGDKNESPRCPQCESVVSDGSRFCSRCGYLIGEKADTLTYTPPLEKILEDSLTFSPGDRFGPRYRIIEEIGRGGMGCVYKAEDEELGITVALKMIRPSYSSNFSFIQSFKKETLLARSITHKNVIRIHDLGEVSDIKFISMDFIKGHDLKDLIHASGCLSTETAINLTRQICEGLNAAHQKKIIHLDLKPRNIMIDHDGKVYIMDFGVSRSLEARKMDPDNKIIGTPAYISPEQAKGEEVDQRSDIYSLGVIIFEMLTGKRPFEADTLDGYIEQHLHKNPPDPTKFNPLIPSFLVQIILRCLEKDKNKRYQDLDTILMDLEKQREESKVSILSRTTKKKWRLFYLLPFLTIIILAAYLLIKKKEVDIPISVESGRIPLVVMPFDNNTGDESLDYQRVALSSGIIQDLLQSKYIKVISSDTLYSILESLNLLDKKSYSSEDLRKVVDKGRAEHVLYGNFTKAENTYRINTILKNAATNKIVDAKRLQGEGDKFFLYAPDQLTPWIRIKLNLDPKEIASDSDSDKNINEILTGSPEAWKLYTLANQYYLQRKYKESIKTLTKAVEIDNEFALAYRMISVNYDYLGEVDRAKEYARKALSLSKKVSLRDSYLVRGWAYLKLEDSYEKAIEIYKEMLEVYPDDEEGNSALGAIYRNTEEWDKALEKYRIVFEVNPSYSSWNIVRSYTAMGQYEKAEKFLLANQKNYGNLLYYHLDLGLIHLCQHNYNLALEQIEQAHSIDPDFFMPAEMKGHLFFLQDNFQRAEQQYLAMLAKDDEASRFYGRFSLAYLYLAQGQHRKCKNEIIQGITDSEKKGLKIDELDYLLLLTYLNMQQGLFGDAREALNQAETIASDIRAKTDKIYILFLQGLVQLRSGKIEEAKDTADRINLAVTETGIHKHIRYHYLLKGLIAESENQISQAILDFERAISFLSRQYQTYDNHALYYYSSAIAYYRSEKLEQAQHQFEKTIDLTLGRMHWGDLYAKSYYWLGKIFQKKGLEDEAEENYRQFLNLWREADPGFPEKKDAHEQLSVLEKKL